MYIASVQVIQLSYASYVRCKEIMNTDIYHLAQAYTAVFHKTKAKARNQITYLHWNLLMDTLLSPPTCMFSIYTSRPRHEVILLQDGDVHELHGKGLVISSWWDQVFIFLLCNFYIRL